MTVNLNKLDMLTQTGSMERFSTWAMEKMLITSHNKNKRGIVRIT